MTFRRNSFTSKVATHCSLPRSSCRDPTVERPLRAVVIDLYAVRICQLTHRPAVCEFTILILSLMNTIWYNIIYNMHKEIQKKLCIYIYIYFFYYFLETFRTVFQRADGYQGAPVTANGLHGLLENLTEMVLENHQLLVAKTSRICVFLGRFCWKKIQETSS